MGNNASRQRAYAAPPSTRRQAQQMQAAQQIIQTTTHADKRRKTDAPVLVPAGMDMDPAYDEDAAFAAAMAASMACETSADAADTVMPSRTSAAAATEQRGSEEEEDDESFEGATSIEELLRRLEQRRCPITAWLLTIMAIDVVARCLT